MEENYIWICLGDVVYPSNKSGIGGKYCCCALNGRDVLLFSTPWLRNKFLEIFWFFKGCVLHFCYNTSQPPFSHILKSNKIIWERQSEDLNHIFKQLFCKLQKLILNPFKSYFASVACQGPSRNDVIFWGEGGSELKDDERRLGEGDLAYLVTSFLYGPLQQANIECTTVLEFLLEKKCSFGNAQVVNTFLLHFSYLWHA